MVCDTCCVPVHTRRIMINVYAHTCAHTCNAHAYHECVRGAAADVQRENERLRGTNFKKLFRRHAIDLRDTKLTMLDREEKADKITLEEVFDTFEEDEDMHGAAAAGTGSQWQYDHKITSEMEETAAQWVGTAFQSDSLRGLPDTTPARLLEANTNMANFTGEINLPYTESSLLQDADLASKVRISPEEQLDSTVPFT